jgi:tripartite-type tricarboxylate transporter receptor subunit TctC
MRNLFKKWVGLAALAALVVSPTTLSQASFPNRVVRIVVPYTVGTTIDSTGRSLGQNLSERWGVPVVIENRAGASGNIGSDAVAKATPDGYTLLLNGTTLVTNPHVVASMPFDVQKSFTPVIHLVTGTFALVTPRSLPVVNMQEFVAYAKGRPGKLHYGSPGNGTPHHVGMEMIKYTLGLDLVHVPYKGTGPGVADLLGGRIDAMLLPTPVALPLDKEGRARILAAGATQRSPVTPHVPSFTEQGLKVDPDYWLAILAPAGTPAEVVRKLNADFNAALADPAVRKTLENQGLVPTGGTPEALARVIAEGLVRWEGVIKAAGIKAD